MIINCIASCSLEEENERYAALYDRASPKSLSIPTQRVRCFRFSFRRCSLPNSYPLQVNQILEKETKDLVERRRQLLREEEETLHRKQEEIQRERENVRLMVEARQRAEEAKANEAEARLQELQQRAQREAEALKKREETFGGAAKKGGTGRLAFSLK